MDQLLSMGFPQELASQALAATGGKSTLKATEWLLCQRASAVEASSAAPNKKQQQQAKVDRFFSSSITSARVVDSNRLPGTDLRDEDESQDPATTAATGKPHALSAFSMPVSEKRKRSDEEANGELQNKAQGHGHFVTEKRVRPEDDNETLPRVSVNPFGSLKSVGAGRGTAKANSRMPLAERMRPSTVAEILGQDHLLGPGCILSSLLSSDTMPSVVFWGPPGTGKTSLAKAISRAVSCRFVTASAVTSGVKEVREILDEARRLKKTGQRTLLFMDEVHRFNKAQQDAFLPAIEAGDVIFIGATTENPSFELNPALLSRCKVLTMNKIQPVVIRQLLERALSNVEKGIMLPYVDDPFVQRIEAENAALDFLAEAADGDARSALNALEIAAASAVSKEKQRSKLVQENLNHSHVANDAQQNIASSTVEWTNSKANMKRELPLKLSALRESLAPSQEEYTRPFKRFVGGIELTPYNFSKEKEMDSDEIADVTATDTTQALDYNPLSVRAKSSAMLPDSDDALRRSGMHDGSRLNGVVVIKVADVSDALQRSHVLYDKKGEEHYNIISALHKSMRGSDPDAALYWLARMLEGGEAPLYIARRLVRFASEDVGLADPQAITLAVSCYQACHFLGMPECNVHLAQCAAYLALAPKSVAVYQAIEAAQQLVRKKGNEPVPLHLRNAPTGLMKQLGYGKGYIYPPGHEGPIEQEYLPPSLRGHKFLKWP